MEQMKKSKHRGPSSSSQHTNNAPSTMKDGVPVGTASDNATDSTPSGPTLSTQRIQLHPSSFTQSTLPMDSAATQEPQIVDIPEEMIETNLGYMDVLFAKTGLNDGSAAHGDEEQQRTEEGSPFVHGSVKEEEDSPPLHSKDFDRKEVDDKASSTTRFSGAPTCVSSPSVPSAMTNSTIKRNTAIILDSDTDSDDGAGTRQGTSTLPAQRPPQQQQISANQLTGTSTTSARPTTVIHPTTSYTPSLWQLILFMLKHKEYSFKMWKIIFRKPQVLVSLGIITFGFLSLGAANSGWVMDETRNILSDLGLLLVLGPVLVAFIFFLLALAWVTVAG